MGTDKKPKTGLRGVRAPYKAYSKQRSTLKKTHSEFEFAGTAASGHKCTHRDCDINNRVKQYQDFHKTH